MRNRQHSSPFFRLLYLNKNVGSLAKKGRKLLNKLPFLSKTSKHHFKETESEFEKEEI